MLKKKSKSDITGQMKKLMAQQQQNHSEGQSLEKQEATKPRGGAIETTASKTLIKLDKQNKELENEIGELKKEQKENEFLKYISIEQIIIDPENPRYKFLTHPITWEEVSGNKILMPEESDIEYKQKRQFLDRINDIASTVPELGIRSSINVSRSPDGNYKIIEGERRYWAARLSDLESMPCTIDDKEPERVKLIQYILNDQKEELTPFARLENLQDIILAEKALGSPVEKIEDLARLIRRSNSSVGNYWPLINPKVTHDITAVIDAIKTERITALKLAGFIAQKKYEEIQSKLIKKVEQGVNHKQLEKIAKQLIEQKNNPENKKKVGRKPKVSLGNVERIDVARHIIEKVSPDLIKTEIDWDDAKAISKLFCDMVKQLEKDL